jgi:hypothetical protein
MSIDDSPLLLVGMQPRCCRVVWSRACWLHMYLLHMSGDWTFWFHVCSWVRSRWTFKGIRGSGSDCLGILCNDCCWPSSITECFGNCLIVSGSGLHPLPPVGICMQAHVFVVGLWLLSFVLPACFAPLGRKHDALQLGPPGGVQAGTGLLVYFILLSPLPG